MIDKYNYTEEEKQRNKVLVYLRNQLLSMDIDPNCLNGNINKTEELIRSLGYGDLLNELKYSQQSCNINYTRTIVVPSWEELCEETNKEIKEQCMLSSLFSDEELKQNEDYIKKLNAEYNELYRLDKLDFTICAVAAILAGVIDVLFIGIPKPTSLGVKSGLLSDYVRDYFEKKFPPEEMEKLGRESAFKVPYDAQDNRNTSVYVEGLSTYYHRLLSLGHDPLLGFIVGVFDIIKGRMTTIDKSGEFVSQVMKSPQEGMTIMSAICRQIRHLKSDITTPMGLPVPLMSLFNLFQFGSIGDEEQTIAEIVQGMYYEGYDFIHFCSMSIPIMLIEVFVRLAYCLKRMKEGYSLKEALPFSLNRERKPKLATMLFIAHSGATAINCGKVYFSENPMAINYPQWLAFGKYAFQQLKWTLINKPILRDKYVMGKLYDDEKSLMNAINADFEEFSKGCIVKFS